MVRHFSSTISISPLQLYYFNTAIFRFVFGLLAPRPSPLLQYLHMFIGQRAPDLRAPPGRTSALRCRACPPSDLPPAVRTGVQYISVSKYRLYAVAACRTTISVLQLQLHSPTHLGQRLERATKLHRFHDGHIRPLTESIDMSGVALLRGLAALGVAGIAKAPCGCRMCWAMTRGPRYLTKL